MGVKAIQTTTDQDVVTEMRIQHAHNDEMVLVVFPIPVTNLSFTVAQAEVFVAAVQHDIDALKARI